MTDEDRKAALQLLAEERVGRRLREAEAAETAQHEKAMAELRRAGGVIS